MKLKRLLISLLAGGFSSCGYVIDNIEQFSGANTVLEAVVLKLNGNLTSPLQVGQCLGPFSIEATTKTGGVVTLTADLAIQISPTGYGAMFSDSACAASITSTTLPRTTGKFEFYLMAPVSNASEIKISSVTIPGLETLTLTVAFEPKESRMDRFAGTLDAFGCHSGKQAEAKVSSPMGLTASATHVYIANTSSHVIFEYELSTKLVTLLAGACFTSGTTDGTGANARFNGPRGMVVEGGALYVADRANHAIRKIDLTTRAVTVFAGLPGTSGITNATGTAARFSSPGDIVSDGTALYVADGGNHAVRKILLSDASVTTLSTTGMSTPSALTLQSGFLYVTNYGSTSVRKVDVTNGTTTLFATISTQTSGITSSSTSLYYSDYVTHQVKAINLGNAAISVIAGSGTTGYADGIGTAAQLNTPHGIVLSGTTVYVLDTYNHLLRKLDLTSQALTTEVGTYGTTGAVNGARNVAARLNTITGIVIHETSMYFSEAGNHLIRKIDLITGTTTTVAGTAGTSGTTDAVGTAAKFNAPQALITDGTDLFVVDKTNHKVRKIVLSSGAVSVVAGDGVSGTTNSTLTASRFASPEGLVKLGSFIYVADTGNHTIRKIDITNNQVTLFAGQAGAAGFTDHSNGVSARFNSPTAITTDGTSLFLADKSNHAIRKINPLTTEVSTFAGSLVGTLGSANGVGTAATFKSPNSISFHSGSFYVSDSGNALVRKIVLSTADVTTLAGTLNMTMDWDDVASVANTVNPLAIFASEHGVFLSNHMNIRWIH